MWELQTLKKLAHPVYSVYFFITFARWLHHLHFVRLSAVCWALLVFVYQTWSVCVI